MNALTPYLLRSVRPLGQASRRRLGFSAIEVTAVAAVIAVLALILMPVVNRRVDESKITAAQDDMSAIQKAQELAFGFTGHYYRLCDLDRPTPDSADTLDVKKLKVPGMYWNMPIPANEKTVLAKTWSGPYLQMQRTITLHELVTQHGDLVDTYDAGFQSENGALGGPILVISGDETDWLTATDTSSGNDNVPGSLKRRRYPVDPWGNPYLFFGPGKLDPPGATAQPFKLDKEKFTNWPNSVVYSLGPDGLPGDVPMTATDMTQFYFRDSEYPLGQTNQHPLGKNVNNGDSAGDDLKREF